MEKNIQLLDPIKLNAEKIRAIKPCMTFDVHGDLAAQRSAIKEKFCELIGYRPPQFDPVLHGMTHDNSDPRFDEYRFYIETEPDFYVPAHLLIPKSYEGKLPLVICLQGHSTGMHVSLGREPYPSRELIEIKGDRDFAIQAVARGLAALALEQRGFGELNFTKEPFACQRLFCQSISMGTSLLADRLLDISCAITAVTRHFDFIDASRIGSMGNSGGGTSSYYAAALDERIKVAMPSSFLATYAEAWGALKHCSCSYIPSFTRYMDIDDLSCLIAPRFLVFVNGIGDPIQPFESAKREFARIREIYAASGADGHCELIAGPNGHRFYGDLSWDTFIRFLNMP